MTPRNYTYDLECFPNVFTMTVHESGQWWVYEISHRTNDISQIIQLVSAIKYHGDRMVGYNNIAYDYPLLHFVLENHPSADQIYEKSMSIITAPRDQRFNHIIWDKNRYADQLDLLKIHHFDNVAKFTSLKMLEFNMRSASIQDLPFEPGTVLTDPQIDTLIRYNRHDVEQTMLFLNETLEMIKFREDLSIKYNRNFLNVSDAKIGEDVFLIQLNELGVATKGPDRKPIQTPRPQIALGEVILPMVQFKKPEFERIKQYFASQVITETKGVFKKLECVVNDFKFVFGAGGIHGSVDNQTFISTDTHVIIDVDVTSYYPSLSIANELYPEHLGKTFCDIYADMKAQRMLHKKGTMENLSLKLSLNASYGKSNSIYSSFYDPKFTMSITINGQLLLCMLSDYMMDIPDLKMIQINTDGITVLIRREYLPLLFSICRWWESYTGLQLEDAEYSRMFISDVNNYLAEYPSGKLKNKGKYAYDLQWHQNHSSLVIPKAAEAYLTRGVPIREFITTHDDPADFLLRTKVPRTSHLLHGTERVQNITRYYISHGGESLTKVMPPLAKKPDHWRNICINVGWNTTVCNDWDGTLPDLNIEYYVKETEKLTSVL